MKKMNSVRPTTHEYYLNVAKAVATRSTCLKRRYGAVIVKNGEIIATGYNGAPRGEENCCDRGECLRLSKPSNSGDYSDCHSVHAEQNALISASRQQMIDAIMFLWGEESYEEKLVGPDGKPQSAKERKWDEIKAPRPCPICARMIKNAGIKAIVTRDKVWT